MKVRGLCFKVEAGCRSDCRKCGERHRRTYAVSAEWGALSLCDPEIGTLALAAPEDRGTLFTED